MDVILVFYRRLVGAPIELEVEHRDRLWRDPPGNVRCLPVERLKRSMSLPSFLWSDSDEVYVSVNHPTRLLLSIALFFLAGTKYTATARCA